MDEEREKMEKRWKKYQEHMGYTDEELAIFRSDPRKVKAIESSPMFVTHNIIAEVIESHNCDAGHKVGDKFVMTGSGYLLADQCPKVMCRSAITAIATHIDGIVDRLFEGLSGDYLLNVVHCADVGVRKGGFGEIIMKIYAEPKKKG